MKKNNLVTMGVSFLLCVGMVGAGFASWVISADVTEEGESTVSVEEVIDQRLNTMIVATNQDSEGWNKGNDSEAWNADLHFGAPKIAESFQNPWLSNVGGKEEDLDVYLGVVFDYRNVEALKEDFSYIQLTFDLDTTDLLDSYAPTKDSYIIEPEALSFAEKDEKDVTISTQFVEQAPIEVVNTQGEIDGFTLKITIENLITTASALADSNKPTEDATELETWMKNYLDSFRFKYVLKFTYKWGTLFGEKNPYNYFNAFGSGDKIETEGDAYNGKNYAEKAFATLTKLSELNADASTGNFNIKVTGKPIN